MTEIGPSDRPEDVQSGMAIPGEGTADPTARSNRPRLLVLVVAYYSETTLAWVLDRIPRQLLATYDCQVLVVDDASGDRTTLVAEEYRRTHPELPLLVLRNRFNQGYGGNQKVGYSVAVREGFDFVAMVHGDGQYAPEELSRLVEPLANGTADAVFGSRMMTRLGALKGGMPLYKYVGNRVLTALQNSVLGTRLSEFHSGYRVYSVAALKRLPFLLNSNDFHFDTEIIIQLVNAEARILELPIPTYYGNEVSRVNGVRYAWNVILASLRNVAHRSGILYQRRYDCDGEGDARYPLKLGYTSSHTLALAAVPAGARVIAIGSGPGGLWSELVSKGCVVTAVEGNANSQPVAGVEVMAQDLDAEPRFDVKPSEYILLLDMIEHLASPELFLKRVRAQLDYEPRTLVLTTPNVAFFVQRFMLLMGQFNYGKAGILDRTHRRLFTFRGLKHLLRDEGFRIRQIRGIPVPFPEVLGSGWLGRLAVLANRILIKLSRTLFSYQIFVIADCVPSVEFVLADAERRRLAQATAADDGSREPLAEIR
jgi:glycosyltransferase involved in cell wall biosynthesis